MSALNIYIESNPNPNSLKFVANRMLVGEGESHDFPDIESAKNAPLAQILFNFPFIKRVFYMNNFVTVTKADSINWEDVKLEIKEFIREYIESGKPILNDEVKKQDSKKDTASDLGEDNSSIDERIISVLEEYIKPAVEMDGGAIQYHSFNDGVVKVLLQGACSGCPSSTLTLKAGIENLLKSMVPEVQSVEAEGV